MEVKTESGEALTRPVSRSCLVRRDNFPQANGKGQVVVKKLTPGAIASRKVDGYEAQKREVCNRISTETVAFLMQPREK